MNTVSFPTPGHQELAGTFGKYVMIEEDDHLVSWKYPVERKRARLANKIYKRVCRDMRLTQCFFSNFSAWSDYVKGRIGEDEFYELAKAEAEKMEAQAKAA
jgi:hypothetical protein